MVPAGAEPTAARRVFVHIGVPKSGTSFIQGTLTQNIEPLRQAGILYPSRHKATMFHAALDMNGHHRAWDIPRERVAGAWEGVCRRALDFEGDAVISSELICGASPDRIGEALRALDGREVHVIVTARDLGRQLPAEWQEGIKHGRRLTFAAFQRRILAGDGAHARRFWYYQDLPRVLERWAEYVTPPRVHVVICPRAGSDPSLLWERFCSVVGVAPSAAVLPDRAMNPSLGITEIEVLRRVNKALYVHERTPMLRRTMKQYFSAQVLRTFSSARATTPAHLVPRLREVAEEWQAQIRRGGYDVVGDLEELMPCHPETAGVDPDRVPPREALDVATESIALMLEEVHRLRTELSEARRKLELARSRGARLKEALSKARSAEAGSTKAGSTKAGSTKAGSTGQSRPPTLADRARSRLGRLLRG
jgi:hypothetical protein